ncbi:MAG: PEP-CTERM sorting domain-containing protein [Planctomycetota bacterium]
MRKIHLATFIAISGMIANVSSGALISDDFEVDSSASYAVLDDGNAPSGDGTPDGAIAFAFDYITAGIPLAPNSTAGDIGGLRMAANETGDDAGAADHISAFHLTSVNSGAYTVSVDIYMAIENAGGTTEFSSVGVGSDGSDFNSIFTPIAGVGQFLSMTGDGGSSSDFRHYIQGTPVNSGDPSYLNSTSTTQSSGDTYQAIYPGGDFPGSPGNRWTTMTISVNPSRVLYSLDGTPVVSAASVKTDGLVGLSYSDVFSSVGPHFVVFDNLVVEIPEPASVSLMVVAVAGLLSRRRS